jgi:hypothetical protein
MRARLSVDDNTNGVSNTAITAMKTRSFFFEIIGMLFSGSQFDAIDCERSYPFSTVTLVPPIEVR